MPIFALTLFLSSALLFVIEPMFAKMLLPLLGSSPAVWTASVLFFQAALLAGYAYAHASTDWLGARRQALLHAALLIVPLAVLPIAIPHDWLPPTSPSPVAWLLILLMVSVGLPFFVVSATGPLLQRWFAATRHSRAEDPYFLYRASNMGSAVGLIAYPLVLERTLSLAQQSRLWSIGYYLLAGLGLACVAALWRTSERASETSPGTFLASDEAPVSWARRLRWVALALVPASLMLGITSYLTVDVAPIPLLWAIPLGLYLLSFVVAFSPRSGSMVRGANRLLPFAILPTALTIVLQAARPIWLLGALHLVTFFVAAVVAHGELFKDRPPARRLTEFYLWIAIGGVLGGVFNALIAPVVFDSFAEYPVAIVLICLLRPRTTTRPDSSRSRFLDVVLPVAVGFAVVLVSVAVRDVDLGGELQRRALLVGLPALACVTFLERPVRFALGTGALVLATSLAISTNVTVLYSNRTFFGIHHVEREEDGRFHSLIHGSTVHGLQAQVPGRRDEPLTYYTRSGPLGQIFSAFEAGRAVRNVAVVGLGAGSMACFAKPGELWTFYEIDPVVAQMATDPRLFTFVRDCLPQPRIVLGDGRLSLERARGERYGLIAIDAFNSDAIPLHLITSEALQVYLSRLAEGGLLAFHISNNYVDLRPALGALAANARLVAFGRDDSVLSEPESREGKYPSDWVVMARGEADLGAVLADERWHRISRRAGFPVWTDDFSNILSVFRWS